MSKGWSRDRHETRAYRVVRESRVTLHKGTPLDYPVTLG